MTTFDAFKHLLHALAPLYGAGESVSIASIVMEDAFGVPPKKLHEKEPFGEERERRLEDICQRLLRSEPVQYVLGQADFCGMKLKVNPAVLIPRQETEETVAWVVETAKENPAAIRRILDVGTGSGCIPVAVKKKLPALEVHTLDISPAALEVARENALSNGAEVHFHQADILDKKAWEALPAFDLVVSNPPYIIEKEKWWLPKNVLDWEPHLAMFTGNNDAQKFVKKIAAFAWLHLSPGGFLLFETNEFYAPKTREVLEKKGFAEVELRKDLNGRDRMLRARKPEG